MDQSKFHLVAAMPHSSSSAGSLYNSLVPSLQHLQGRALQTAETSLPSERPFAKGTNQQASQPPPFLFLKGLTELTLSQYPHARLPEQDLQQLSLLTNLKTLRSLGGDCPLPSLGVNVTPYSAQCGHFTESSVSTQHACSDKLETSLCAWCYTKHI